jgi:hypothetical protein
MSEAFWGTTNIKVASAVATYGGKPRTVDPVTTQIFEDGRKQVTFWFESNGAGDKARAEMERSWAEMQSDEESPIRYIRAALENRETLLGLVKRAEPIRVIKRGNQTLFVAENAKPEIKKAILKHL